MKAIEERTRDAAFHEAAHAVLARKLGMRVDSVFIGGEEERGTAIVQVEEHTERRYEDHLLVSWAGWAADHKRRRYENVSEQDLSALYKARHKADKRLSDLFSTRLTLFKSGRISNVDAEIDAGVKFTAEERQQADELVLAARVAAQVLVREHWRAISRVAEALLRQKTLSQDELDAEIARAPSRRAKAGKR